MYFLFASVSDTAVSGQTKCYRGRGRERQVDGQCPGLFTWKDRNRPPKLNDIWERRDVARHRHLFSCSCGGIRSSGRVQMSLCEDSFLFQDGDSEIFLVQFHQGVLPGIIFNAQIKRDYVMRAHHSFCRGKELAGASSVLCLCVTGFWSFRSKLPAERKYLAVRCRALSLAFSCLLTCLFVFFSPWI